jgi:hypothetical protein
MNGYYGHRYDPYVGGALPPISQAQRSPLMAAVVSEFQRAYFRKPASWMELLDFLANYTLELYGEAGLNEALIKQRFKAFMPGPW